MHSILLSAFALVGALSAPWPAAAQDAKQAYASLAPLEQYLMDRNAEIALARSAAPDASRTTLQLLGRLATKPRLKARMAGCAWWNADGWRPSTVPNFGT